MTYIVKIPPDVVQRIKHLNPLLKKQIKAALVELQDNHQLGKELTYPLQGLHSYRVVRYRIIYRIKSSGKIVEIIDVDHRSVIYEKLNREFS